MAGLLDLLKFADDCVQRVLDIKKIYEGNKSIPAQEQDFLKFLTGLQAFFTELKSKKDIYSQFESQLGGTPQNLEMLLDETYQIISDYQSRGFFRRFIGYIKPETYINTLNDQRQKILQSLQLISNQASTLNWMNLNSIYEQIQNQAASGEKAIFRLENETFTSPLAKEFWLYYFSYNNATTFSELKDKLWDYFYKIQSVFATENIINTILQLSFDVQTITPTLIDNFFLQIDKLKYVPFLPLDEFSQQQISLQQNEEYQVESIILINTVSNKWILLRYIYEVRRKRFSTTIQVVKLRQSNSPQLLSVNQQINLDFTLFDEYIFGRQTVENENEESKQRTVTIQLFTENHFHPFDIDDRRISSQQFQLRVIAIPLVGKSGQIEDFKFTLGIKNTNRKLNTLVLHQKLLNIRKGSIFKANQKSSEYITIMKTQAAEEKEESILKFLYQEVPTLNENEVVFLEENKFEWGSEIYYSLDKKYLDNKVLLNSNQLYQTLDDFAQSSLLQKRVKYELQVSHIEINQQKIIKKDHLFNQNFKITNQQQQEGIQLKHNMDSEVSIDIQIDKITSNWQIKNNTQNPNLFQVVGYCEIENIQIANEQKVKNETELATLLNLQCGNYQQLFVNSIICVEDYWFKVIQIQ